MRQGHYTTPDLSPTPRHCLAGSITHVRALHENRCDLTHQASPSATVVMIRRRGPELEYLVLADSVLVVDRVGHDPLIVTDDRADQIGQKFRARRDALDTSTPEHAAASRDYVETLYAYRNCPGGFRVASVDPTAAQQALTGTVPLGDIRAVVLLSDGASRLVDRFGLATWPGALELLASDGPHELIRQVRHAETSDPTGSRWPRGKTHDDATIAYLNTVPGSGKTPLTWASVAE